MFQQIKGVDPRRVEYVVRRPIQEARFPPGAIGPAAISAIDHALWDVAGEAAGLPVYMLLGGQVGDRVPVCCGVYIAPDPLVCRDLTQSPLGGQVHDRVPVWLTARHRVRRPAASRLSTDRLRATSRSPP
ncbi:hypothetical protein ACQP2T_09300 [Nonomuraea sp. CA-143628]|uniref:hypothetical protein n=1 Tax=Nonomuraea sp. CA-143628 TaxID=3239997 RepID=UPI003D8E874E